MARWTFDRAAFPAVINRLTAPALVALAVGLSACGSNSSSSADSGSAAAPAATATMAPMSTPATQTSSATDASSGKITVKATEFAFAPHQIAAKAGKLTITMENDGQAVHELVVLKTDAAPGTLKVTGGEVSEADSVGEISETNPGKSKSHTFDLGAGKYVIVCNQKGHYMQGMFGQLIVS